MAAENAPATVKKALYVEQNCFDIPQDAQIYRLFQFAYLTEDIRRNQLTHLQPEVWNDPWENPLRNHVFKEENGETVSLRGIIDKLFAQSWTLSATESLDFWDEFSRGKPAVRVQTTVGKLLDRVMSLQNRFYMLSHFAGRVNYYTKAEIFGWLNSSHYTDFLDPLGQRAVLSLMALRNDFSPEQEARLVYWHQPSTDNEWAVKTVHIQDHLCRVPFEWPGIIDEVVIGPRVRLRQRPCIRNFFRSVNVSCPIRDSSLS